MDTNDFYGMQGQGYARSGVSNARSRVSNINAKRAAQNAAIPTMQDMPSQAAAVLSNIVSERNDQRVEALQAAKDAKYEAIMSGSEVSGLGPMSQEVAGPSNVPAGTLQEATQKIDNQKLKYSQKRGKGCTDCSAFTQKIYKDTYGKDIGGWTGTQVNAGKAVAPGQQKYGDLVLFDTKDGRGLDVSHVGYDNGNGTFTHFSSGNGGGVKVTPYKGYYPVKHVRRVI